ncbi:MAG: hypothetical protein ACTHPS_24895 [Streptosporangiaceae bacterium]
MASCRQGHPVSAESEFCEICGDDIRPRCSQGHRSGVGARFCETCGEPLLAGQDRAADEDPVMLVLDYRSGSFTDFIAGDQPDSAGAAAANQRNPAGAAAPDPGNPAGRPGLPEPWRDARADVPPEPAPERRRRRGRMLVLVLALIVLAAGGTAGAIALRRHQPTAPQAGPPRGGSAPASQPGSATPTASHRPELPVGTSGWTAPVPIDRAPSAGNATISGLSCPRLTGCYAVDSAGNVLSSTSRSAARRGPWRVVASDPGGGLAGISWPTGRFWLAVDEAGNAITLSHGSWSSPVYVNARSGIFTAVSCPVAAFCMAVDSGGNAFAYAAASNTWQPFTVTASGAGLTGVSCTGPGRCIAVDDGGSAYTYNGGSWSDAFPVDAGHAFTAVSCASRAFCAATDADGKGAILTGGTWTVSAMGTTAGTLACPADGSCLATTGSGGAVAYRNGVWSRVTRIDGRRAIGALSCPAVTACTAVDRQDNVLYYAPPPSG